MGMITIQIPRFCLLSHVDYRDGENKPISRSSKKHTPLPTVSQASMVASCSIDAIAAAVDDGIAVADGHLLRLMREMLPSTAGMSSCRHATFSAAI